MSEPPKHPAGRFPGYDVLAKRGTPSWNQQTRDVVDERLAVPRDDPQFFTAEEFAAVEALAARIVPQPPPAPIPVAALVDRKLQANRSDGYRQAGMPRQREAWRQGLRALDAECRAAHGGGFCELAAADQDALLRRMQAGELTHEAWGTISPKTFFTQRLARDIVLAYAAHPVTWNHMGWGGPASPRGYVRVGYDERDAWEAAEVKDDVEAARRKNRHVV